MKFLKNKIVIITVLLAVLLIFIFMLNQWLYLRKAHSTFENYYAFRGCISLVKRTNDYGICKLSSGQEIKIVRFQNRWYLNGDLP